MSSGAKILIESLIKNEVDTIFGYPGGSILNIYDELLNYKDKIQHILVSHEQHAAHAADGYARSTGKVGVCLATSGPGATNLVTGIATAFMDSVPIVAITGNVGTHLLGKDSFQEVDITGITMPIVKHNWIVKDLHDLQEIINEAFIVAKSGRPGPVLIDIPKDVSSEQLVVNSEKLIVNSEKRALRFSKRVQRETYNEADIEKAIELIKNSKQPMIFAGGGLIRSDACIELKKIAETLNIPVALSLNAMGAFAAEHPLCTGLIGMHGTVASNKAVQKCDLLIALGTRFSDRVTSCDSFAKNAKIIHIDIDPAEINKNINTDFFIIGDLKEVLNKLIKRLPTKISFEWGDQIDIWKAKRAFVRKTSLHPKFIIQQTAKALGDETIAVTDVGQHQIWTAQFFPFKKPRKFLSSGGMGTMGFGMGASIGAKIANPKTNIVLFTGDGSFRMNSAEMATLVKYKLPVLIIVFNNSTLGMLRQWQTYFYKERYFQTALENCGPDFVKLAAAYNVSAFSTKDEKSFIVALDAAVKLLASGKAVLIEVIIDKDEKVVPMTPSGKPVDEQIL